MRALLAVLLLLCAAGCTCDQRFATLATIDGPVKLTATSVRFEHIRNRPFETTFEYGCVTLWLGESEPPQHPSGIDDEALFGLSCRQLPDDAEKPIKRVRIAGSPSRGAQIWLEPNGRRAMVKVNGERSVVLLEPGSLGLVLEETRHEVELPDGGIDWRQTVGVLEALDRLDFRVSDEELEVALDSAADSGARLRKKLELAGRETMEHDWLVSRHGVGSSDWQRAIDHLGPGDRQALEKVFARRALHGDPELLTWLSNHPEQMDQHFADAIEMSIRQGMIPQQALAMYARDHGDEAGRLACTAFEHAEIGASNRLYGLALPAAIVARQKAKCPQVTGVLQASRCDFSLECTPGSVCTPDEQKDEVDALNDNTGDDPEDFAFILLQSHHLGPSLLAAAAVQGPIAPALFLGLTRARYRRVFQGGTDGRPGPRCRGAHLYSVELWLCTVPNEQTETSDQGCHVHLDDREQTATFSEEAP